MTNYKVNIIILFFLYNGVIHKRGGSSKVGSTPRVPLTISVAMSILLDSFPPVSLCENGHKVGLTSLRGTNMSEIIYKAYNMKHDILLGNLKINK